MKKPTKEQVAGNLLKLVKIGALAALIMSCKDPEVAKFRDEPIELSNKKKVTVEATLLKADYNTAKAKLIAGFDAILANEDNNHNADFLNVVLNEELTVKLDSNVGHGRYEVTKHVYNVMNLDVDYVLNPKSEDPKLTETINAAVLGMHELGPNIGQLNKQLRIGNNRYVDRQVRQYAAGMRNNGNAKSA